MAKLIGTGKDPRFPQGQDYDVPEQDLQHHIDANLGEPVEPGNEALAVHRGYDTIGVDPAEEPIGRPTGSGSGVPPTQEDVGTASRVSARVETTSGPGKEPQDSDKVLEHHQGEAEELGAARGQADQSSDPEADGRSQDASGGLSQLKRAELEERAQGAGIEDPKSFNTKEDLVNAIREREGDGASGSEGDSGS